MIRPLLMATVFLIVLLAAGCAPLHLDPSLGRETLAIRAGAPGSEEPLLVESRALWPDRDITYIRPAAEGPVVLTRNAWWLLWFIPMNHPSVGALIEESLPEGAIAANLKVRVKMPWYGPVLFFPSLGTLRVERVTIEFDPVQLVPATKPLPPAE